MSNKAIAIGQAFRDWYNRLAEREVILTSMDVLRDAFCRGWDEEREVMGSMHGFFGGDTTGAEKHRLQSVEAVVPVWDSRTAMEFDKATKH